MAVLADRLGVRTGAVATTRGAAAEAMSSAITCGEIWIGSSASETSEDVGRASAVAGAANLAPPAAGVETDAVAAGRRAEGARGGAAAIGRARGAAGRGAGAGRRVPESAGGVGTGTRSTGRHGSRDATIASRLGSPGETASSSASAACAASASPRPNDSCASATARSARRPRTRPSNVDQAASDTRPAADASGATGMGELRGPTAAPRAARPWSAGRRSFLMRCRRSAAWTLCGSSASASAIARSASSR